MTTPLLPLDILSNIPLFIDWTQRDQPETSKDAQLACCLASRVFVHGARRCLFHSLELNGNHEREKALASRPHLTGYVRSLWLVCGFENSELGSVAAIFKNTPNIAEFRVHHCFPREEILAHNEARDAFLNHLGPLVHRLILSGVSQFGTFFLSAFTNIRCLDIAHCILQLDEPLMTFTPPMELVSQLGHLSLAFDAVQDNNLAALTRTFEYQGVQLRKLRWLSVETADDTWSQGHPPGVAFTKFFAGQSQNIADLEVSLCRLDEVNMDHIPPNRHP
ncbi:hypothetical protein DL96DRAFT_786588 [Flagelloscypha sp. PMI_526]|nr:hypothetical protein DL96DRAFT_786588 [Flagelloscypha sp. PMI_526]